MPARARARRGHAPRRSIAAGGRGLAGWMPSGGGVKWGREEGTKARRHEGTEARRRGCACSGTRPHPSRGIFFLGSRRAVGSRPSRAPVPAWIYRGIDGLRRAIAGTAGHRCSGRRVPPPHGEDRQGRARDASMSPRRALHPSPMKRRGKTHSLPFSPPLRVDWTLRSRGRPSCHGAVRAQR